MSTDDELQSKVDDTDGELLSRVAHTKDFFQSLLYTDTLPDWNVAKDFGEFLVRIFPDDIMGHAMLVRAHRHLGDLERARYELNQCREHIKTHELEQWEAEDFLPLLAEEERLLGGATRE